MMHKKKFLILFSFSIFQLSISGQEVCPRYLGTFGYFCEDIFNTARINAYKAIIQSKELQSDAKCNIVTIQSVSLKMKHQYNYGFYDIKEIQDTISVESLRKQLPNSYWVYRVDDRLTNMLEGTEYFRHFQTSDTLYAPIPKYYEDETCNFKYNIIKIYEPMDKWAGVYSANFESSASKAVIPVKYEYLNNVSISEKYLIYEIKLFANGGIESVKVTETK